MKNHLIEAVFLVLFFIWILVFGVGCSGKGESGVLIGPEGGIITSSDGTISIFVPEGALDKDTFISTAVLSEDLLPIPPPEGNFLVVGVELKPNGLEFNTPVTITVLLDTEFQPGTPFPLLVFNPIDNIFELEGEAVVSEDGTSISWQTTHFSIWGVLFSIICQRSYGAVKVKK